ncbi:uncharacterized protein KY384_003766 [Bacidia gigantensis]|uniref:uncharacterized protein n=1 Tax=Bacidia gigantensis TaxID=2732470 RepID=UPI001D04529F|nr:uncharacterized protein KY384_003766 [Bacidia gigantensis]KAG8532127.1 hypothetical protein KY384_003766 [Bacidia gigantensis]
MSSAQGNEAEKNIEIWKVKKLIKRLEAARGNGTSMISLIIPPKDQVSRAAKMLAEEFGTASNIKSRVNRLSVLSAITSTQQRLKLYNKVPPNGLVVYCGEIITSEGKERKINIDFEPFKPINTSLYLCDNKFHTEALSELLESDQKFGFIIMDGNGALFGTLSGNTRDVIHKFSVDLPKKHGRGGQSALRFARLREEKRHNYVRKVAELAVQNFITTDKVNVAGLILAGSADFKNDLNQSDMFDNRLSSKVIKVVDVSYGGENGFNQAIELASETLSNVKFIQEKKLIGKYFDEISVDSGKVCYGVDDTIKALEGSAVEVLIVYENLEITRWVLRTSGGSEVILHTSKGQEAQREQFLDKESGQDMEIVEQGSMLEWLAEHYKDFGAQLEFVSDRSSEGNQFVKGFGGIGGILRYKLNFEQLAELDEEDEFYDGEAEVPDDRVSKSLTALRFQPSSTRTNLRVICTVDLASRQEIKMGMSMAGLVIAGLRDSEPEKPKNPHAGSKFGPPPHFGTPSIVTEMAARIVTLNGSGDESPKSDQSQTRFSTPVSDLDDHRKQTSTRSRGDTVDSRHSLLNVPDFSEKTQSHSGLLQVNEGLRDMPSPSRASEHAMIDDDVSARGEHIIERHGSSSPVTTRRATLRNTRTPPPKSRDSSPSSRSSSPADSVAAFAEGRRRERRNTVDSRASDLDLRIHRTISGASYHQRPSFNNGSIRNPTIQDDRTSIRAAEEDVCFPTAEEPSKASKIDFEELDEYAASQAVSRLPLQHGFRQKHSFSCGSGKPKRVIGLQAMAIPTIKTHSSPSLKQSSDCAIDDSDTVLNEKLDAATDAALGADGLKPRRPSLTETMRYSFFSTNLQQTVHAADFVDLLAPGETFRDLFDIPKDKGAWWLDILNPDEEEMEVLQKAFGIHRLTTEDIITQEPREKVELFDQYYFVCFRSFFQVDEKHEDYMEPVNVYMVVFREGLLTITYETSPHAANVRKRIGRLRDYMELTADWICYALIDNIVDTFGPPIHNVEIEADTIEDQVFVARTEDFASLLRQIGKCRKKVMSLMRLLGGKADVIKGFAKRCNEQYSVTPRGEIGLYLGDIQDHVVTMMSNLGHFEKMLSRSHSNYLAQLSVDHLAQGNTANEVLSKITLLASILVPLNLICGLFGMNVNVPGKTQDGLGWFFGIIGVIAVFVVISLVAARRLKFI